MTEILLDMFRETGLYRSHSTLDDVHQWAANEINYLRQIQNMLSDMHAAAINELAITRAELDTTKAKMSEARNDQ